MTTLMALHSAVKHYVLTVTGLLRVAAHGHFLQNFVCYVS